jgi:hypothetical protein
MDLILLILFPSVALSQSNPPKMIQYSGCAVSAISVALMAQFRRDLVLIGLVLHSMCSYIAFRQKQDNRTEHHSSTPEVVHSSTSSLYFKGERSQRTGVNLFSPSPTQKQPLILFSPTSDK